MRRPGAIIFLLTLSLIALFPDRVHAAGAESDHGLIQAVGISIIAASILAFIGSRFKQPTLLAYIIAGVLIGPEIGFGLVHDESSIAIMSEIGLILLLFMIGLEIDIKQLREAGKSMIVPGFLQFLLCVVMGLGFFALLGFTVDSGRYDLGYLAVCCAISSTTIVVKLLHEKYELHGLPGRLTLGVLVFQDLWAIVVLGLQPNLANPEVLGILWSFGRGAILVVISLVLSKYLLGRIFRSIAKLPELVLIASLGWCFLICALARAFDLSLEMGALIAGAAISTFPYNLDVISKIVSIRDFFLTLFFVALGMSIPNPMENLTLVGIAAVTSVFVVFSRFATLFPILWGLGNGNRVSLLAPINLSQISEFSLVIAALGVAHGHIGQEILTLVVFTFAITSTVSTYMIQYSHQLQDFLNRAIQSVGIRDLADSRIAEHHSGMTKEIAILGFHRVAGSFVAELESSPEELRNKLLVIDFNPEVFQKLTAMGVKTVYGDIGSIETLRHAGIGGVKIIISTVFDTILKGTDNLKIIGTLRKLNPDARIIVTAESVDRANRMYREGADYVLLPRLLTARHLLEVVRSVEDGTIGERKARAMEEIDARQEIVS